MVPEILPLTDIQLDRLNIFLRHQACIDLLDISTILPICHKVKSFLIFPIMIKSSKRPRLEIMKFKSFYENFVVESKVWSNYSCNIKYKNIFSFL